MSVVIRLSRYGRKKRPFYRIVAADRHMPRDGRFLELLGTMNPLHDPPLITLKEDRVKYWVGEGARPSDTAGPIIDRVMPGYLGDLEKNRLEKIRSRRAKRKAAHKSKPAKKASKKAAAKA